LFVQQSLTNKVEQRSALNKQLHRQSKIGQHLKDEMTLQQAAVLTELALGRAFDTYEQRPSGGDIIHHYGWQ
jgi:hypothetical protein